MAPSVSHYQSAKAVQCWDRRSTEQWVDVSVLSQFAHHTSLPAREQMTRWHIVSRLNIDGVKAPWCVLSAVLVVFILQHKDCIYKQKLIHNL